jgi:hypothetical protein
MPAETPEEWNTITEPGRVAIQTEWTPAQVRARIRRDIAAMKAEAAEKRRKREASARYRREVAVREYGRRNG